MKTTIVEEFEERWNYRRIVTAILTGEAQRQPLATRFEQLRRRAAAEKEGHIFYSKSGFQYYIEMEQNSETIS